MSLNQELVYVGLTPNDGTGSNLRDAFVTYNQNVTELKTFINNGPTLPTAVITNLNSDIIIANVGIFNTNLSVLSSTLSTSRDRPREPPLLGSS